MAKAKLKAVPPPRTPARSALALAIEKYEQAKRALAGNQAAIAAASDKIYAAREFIEQAKQSIEKARQDAATLLTQQMLGEGNDPDRPISIAEAREALRAAEENLEIATSARSALEAQAKDLKQAQIPWAEVGLDAAVREVLRSEAAAALETLAATYRDLKRQIVDLDAVLEWATSEGILPRGWRVEPTPGDRPNLARWRDAAARLREDCDFPLPT
jgi:hypothetical protein